MRGRFGCGRRHAGEEGGGLLAQIYVRVPGSILGVNLTPEGGVAGKANCLCQGRRGGGQGRLPTLVAPGSGERHTMSTMG
jgi:hypothetical protein